MARPYDYDCNCGYSNDRGQKGRQSDVLLNGEMHDIYEAVKHIIDCPSDSQVTPEAKHRGALWLDQRTNQLYMWVGHGYKHGRVRNGWLPVFADKFQIFDEMISDIPDSAPVVGQLWLYGGVLMYFDGSAWQPVKTVEKSDSQINTAMFADYQIISPLNRIGSAVISDLQLEAYLALQQRYFEGDIDIKEHADLSIDSRWNWGDFNKKQLGVIDFDLDDISYQYIVPNMKVDRIFMDDVLDTNYLLQNNSTIQYKRSYLLDERPSYDDNTPMISHVKTPSLIHVNPGKITNIRKRFFKIDKVNPKICCPALNTEFYGFVKDDIGGHFLIPKKQIAQVLSERQQIAKNFSDKNKEAINQKLKDYGYDIDSLFVEDINAINGDYDILNDGIYLSYKTSQQYDYVLAITFEFSWMSATGQLRQGDNRTGSCSFYVPQKLGSTNIFINGFDYESNYYTWDQKNNVVTVAEDIHDKDNFDISILNVFKHEYGYIREIDITPDNQVAHITTIQDFIHPLIFVNGEVLLRSQWEYYNRNTLQETNLHTRSYSIIGVRRDMCWTIIDMQKEEKTYDINGKETGTQVIDICIDDNGYIPTQDFAVDSNGNPAIPLPLSTKISYEEIEDESLYRLPKVVLFVNGLMVRREDVRYDPIMHVITTEGLRPNMHYVLLDDKEGNLYTEEMEQGIKAAISVGQLDESIVYYNGYLLSEAKAYRFEGDESYATSTAMHGEIRAFNNETSWKIFNAEYNDKREGVPGVWDDAPDNIAEEIKYISNSYTNTKTAVIVSDGVTNTSRDAITVFGYQLANFVEKPFVPVTCWLHLNDGGKAFLKEAGYSEDYSIIVKKNRDNAVYVNKIDPTNLNLVQEYQEKKEAYYNFLIRAFNIWQTERGFENSNTTMEELATEYYRDSQRTPGTIANYLSGYFFDEVYMRNEADELTYIDLRESTLGSLWVNKVFIGKEYNPVTDYVMVWINGVRQYPEKNYLIVPVYERDILKGYNIVLGHMENDTIVEAVDNNGFIEVPHGQGTIVPDEFKREPLTGILTYVIERAENGSRQACRYTVLDNTNMVENSQNVYTTRDRHVRYLDELSFTRDTSNDFSLYPGKVTLYADGIRMPRSSYTILDNYTIIINDTTLWAGGSRYPTEQYFDHNGNIQTKRHLKPEEILVEVRETSQWNEKSFYLDKSFYGDINLFSNETGVSYDILDTQDTIMIFIDGLYHGLTLNDGYLLNKIASTISLRDSTVVNALRRDNIEDYLAMNPEIAELRSNEINAYRLRKANKLHQITLEWR